MKKEEQPKNSFFAFIKPSGAPEPAYTPPQPAPVTPPAPAKPAAPPPPPGVPVAQFSVVEKSVADLNRRLSAVEAGFADLRMLILKASSEAEAREAKRQSELSILRDNILKSLRADTAGFTAEIVSGVGVVKTDLEQTRAAFQETRAVVEEKLKLASEMGKADNALVLSLREELAEARVALEIAKENDTALKRRLAGLEPILEELRTFREGFKDAGENLKKIPSLENSYVYTLSKFEKIEDKLSDLSESQVRITEKNFDMHGTVLELQGRVEHFSVLLEYFRGLVEKLIGRGFIDRPAQLKSPESEVQSLINKLTK